VDTRAKIVGVLEFAERVQRWKSEGIEVIVAAGTFDPVLAAHAIQTAAARPREGRLAVIIADAENPVLPAPARAELAAGLSAVDLVALEAPGLPEPDVTWASQHTEIGTRFVAHVLSRMS